MRTAVPFHIAALKGDTALGAMLVNAGANKDAKDNLGSTPLDWATKDSEVYKILQRHGAHLGSEL